GRRCKPRRARTVAKAVLLDRENSAVRRAFRRRATATRSGRDEGPSGRCAHARGREAPDLGRALGGFLVWRDRLINRRRVDAQAGRIAIANFLHWIRRSAL